MLHGEALIGQQSIIVDAAHHEHCSVVSTLLAGCQAGKPHLKGQGSTWPPACQACIILPKVNSMTEVIHRSPWYALYHAWASKNKCGL